jgi:MFS family permease
MLALVRDTVTTDAQVDALLAPDRFSAPEQVQDELLDQVVPAAYAPRPGQPPARYTAAQAERWLGFVAHRMRADHTRDLAWWRLTDRASAMPRMAVTAIVAGVASGFVAGLLGGLGSGLGGWATSALIAGVLFGPACGFIYGSGGGTPVQLGSIRWSTLVNWRTAVFGVAIGLAVGLLVGFTVGLGSGVVLGLAVGLVAGLLAGLLLAMSRTSTDERSPISPLTCWRRDRQYGLVYGLTVGLSFGIMFGLLTGLKAGLAYGLLVGLAFGLTFALTVGLTLSLIFPEAWPAALTFVQLHRSGGGPVRLMRFLEDAHARHVLRTAGPVYQFRHARLQERLADRYARFIARG